MSLPVSVRLAVPSSNSVTVCADATGASLTEVTVIETRAGAEFTVPSLAVKTKLSDP